MDGKCVKKFEERLARNSNDAHIIISAMCKPNQITIPFIQQTITKKEFGVIVVVMDLLMCIFFMIFVNELKKE